MRIKSPDELLADRIRIDAEKCGVHLDTYDPDFILATIYSWLADNDAILTESGVQKKDWR